MTGELRATERAMAVADAAAAAPPSAAILPWFRMRMGAEDAEPRGMEDEVARDVDAGEEEEEGKGKGRGMIAVGAEATEVEEEGKTIAAEEGEGEEVEVEETKAADGMTECVVACVTACETEAIGKGGAPMATDGRYLGVGMSPGAGEEDSAPSAPR